MNINDKVKVQPCRLPVQLTPFGADIWNKRWDGLNIPSAYTQQKVTPFDYIELQLWDAMNVFGPHMRMGSDVPFVDCQMEIM